MFIKKVLRYRALSLLLMAVPSLAWGFAEDVCFSESNRIFNCMPLPQNCAPGNYSRSCLRALLSNTVQASSNKAAIAGSRSTVHMDMTYYLAQFVGFSADQAYWIAAYSEAADLHQYVPRGNANAVLADPASCEADPSSSSYCKYITKDINGLSRDNIGSGGIFLHFAAPFNGMTPAPPSGTDGLEPNEPQQSSEIMLNHLRAWALGGNMLCAGGLTTKANKDYWSGPQCYVNEQGVDTAINGQVSLVENFSGDTDVSVSFVTFTGPQQILDDVEGVPLVYAPDFDAYIGDHAQMARIGIYLHAYQDRISHHRCLDASYVNGPDPASLPQGQWSAAMINSECQQTYHLARHAWEAGTPQYQLITEDRTLKAGLDGSYGELLSIATALGIASSRTADTTLVEQFSAQIYTQLQVKDPRKRVAMLSRTASSFGLSLMPGY